MHDAGNEYVACACERRNAGRARLGPAVGGGGLGSREDAGIRGRGRMALDGSVRIRTMGLRKRTSRRVPECVLGQGEAGFSGKLGHPVLARALLGVCHGRLCSGGSEANDETKSTPGLHSPWRVACGKESRGVSPLWGREPMNKREVKSERDTTAILLAMERAALFRWGQGDPSGDPQTHRSPTRPATE